MEEGEKILKEPSLFHKKFAARLTLTQSAEHGEELMTVGVRGFPLGGWISNSIMATGLSTQRPLERRRRRGRGRCLPFFSHPGCFHVD